MNNFLSSDDLNPIVYRYLLRSGFDHTASAFEKEANLNRLQTETDSTLEDSLVRLVSKGVRYMEMEANDVEADEAEDFAFLQPMDIITKDVSELKKIVEDKKQEARQKDLKARKDKGKQVLSGDDENMDIHQETHGTRQTERTEIPGERLDMMDMSATSTSHASVIPPSEVIILDGHASEVYSCAWSPSGSRLAFGSQNSTAHICTIFDGTRRPISGRSSSNLLVLSHVTPNVAVNTNLVSALEWNEDGTLLGTASFDGKARIWNSHGQLKHIFVKRREPLLTLKWNKSNNFILTGSNNYANVWSVKKAKLRQQYPHDSGGLLDVDWQNDDSFATCSIDHKIRIWKLGQTSPIKIFSSHQNAVNAVKWDPTGSLLASCSYDCTVKIWTINQQRSVHNFTEHEKDINAIQWSPNGPGTNNSNQASVLASASTDSTVKLWDIEQGRLLSSLERHRESVNAIAFSPNGEYLVSGCHDGVIYIWSVKEGKAIKSYTGEGRIADVCWSKDGNMLAACFLKTVCVLDVRM